MTLETLLNKLIELWLKPRWIEVKKIQIYPLEPNNLRIHFSNTVEIFWESHTADNCLRKYSLNDLCSLDSWLWQFICEKWLYKNYYLCPRHSYKYWLMESSIQEDKAKFLLDYIKIEW